MPIRRLFRTELLLASALLVFGTGSPTYAQQKEVPLGRTMLVLDASGSMWGKLQGKHKIEVARQTIRKVMQSWPEELEIGLTAYGHRREGDCNDIQTLIPTSTDSREKIVRAVDNLKPKGKTPLSQAVKMAAQRLSYTKVPATVILVTDGLETCNADPCELGKQLKATGVDFKAHVIGFDIGKKDQTSLRCLANETGGSFFDARSAADLALALTETATRVETDFGAPVRFQATLRKGGKPLSSELDTQTLGWKFFKLNDDGKKLTKPVLTTFGDGAAVNFEPGSYVAELNWDAVIAKYPFSVEESEKATHTIVLNAAVANLDATLKTNVEPVRGQVAWTTFEHLSNGQTGQKLLYKAGAKVQLVLPAGASIVTAKHDTAVSSEVITLEAGDVIDKRFNFRAGTLALSASLADGSPAKGYATWTAYRLEPGRGKTKVGFKSDRNPRFVLSAGKYLIDLQLGGATYQQEMDIVEGSETDQSIVVSNAN